MDINIENLTPQIIEYCKANVHSAGSDRVAWSYTPHGLFTTRSAYLALTSPTSKTVQPIWKAVWRAPAAQRVRHFLWIAVRNRLFTNGERWRRHLTDDDGCAGCGQLESTIHVLRDCPKARSIWDRLLPRPYREEFFSSELRSWIWSNLSGSGDDGMDGWATIFAITCWRIWFWRNMGIFSHKDVSLEVKVQDVRRRVAQFRDATSCEAVLAILLQWKLFNNHTKKPSKIPLGSFGIRPFVGETIHFVSCAYSDRPERFTNKRRRMYGDVFKSHLFGSPTIVSTDAEVNRVVLQSDSTKFVPSYPKSLMELMGKNSILVVNGALQRRIHGLIGNFLKSPFLKAQITADMQKYVTESMENWREDCPVYIQDEAKNIGFKVLVKALISVECGDEMELLKKHFQEFIAGLMSLPINLPGTQLYRSLQVSF
ncbi:3-epi-6-deoxocathasterone 23-monooxygenase [Striga hermonthica]|uniref:3-epi-6-deoxocathasterone 23-monooxygenase n=1 Tax=Striga hermonthica TaxID=68872 RepID=A0A9N7MSC3_STRHE|nr:3-epi-6-deoxocathasterone 23-monooxygenase [Striga hermonthica]